MPVSGRARPESRVPSGTCPVAVSAVGKVGLVSCMIGGDEGSAVEVVVVGP